jgi:predicted DCC family thiol-disulfide oxidoreductase YuxK
MESDILLLYDGECMLCNKFVEFVRNKDKPKKIKLTPYQSKEGEPYNHLLILDQHGTVAIIKHGEEYIKSDAVLKVFEILGGVFYPLTILKWIPQILRDKIYDFIAKHRLLIFGKKENCSTLPLVLLPIVNILNSLWI